MTLPSLLESLTNDEREFIAELDYGNDADQHRCALDEVIASNGIVDFKSQGYWHPYEVIELGKNWLQVGHEGEYAACLGIVLKNIEIGSDQSNDLEWIIENQTNSISQLPSELQAMITELSDNIINNANKAVHSTAIRPALPDLLLPRFARGRSRATGSHR
ncbi:MAG: hypothetical protein HC904_17385 [Blastochloris sp.]|nr:hypothetical protein [Blastochloris sp.]